MTWEEMRVLAAVLPSDSGAGSKVAGLSRWFQCLNACVLPVSATFEHQRYSLQHGLVSYRYIHKDGRAAPTYTTV